MNGRDYQEKAHAFASYGGNPMYPALGLAEEAGEVCGKIAKFIRHNNGEFPWAAAESRSPSVLREVEKLKADLMSELSDVMWMVAEIATLNGLGLDEIMEYNIAKLAERKNKGLIDGSGDTIAERLANR